MDHVGMKSGPGSGGLTNAFPGAIVPYTVLDNIPPSYPYVPPPLLGGIDA